MLHRRHVYTKRLQSNRGQILILVLIFFSAIAVTVVTGVTSPIVRGLRISSDLQLSKQSYFTAEAGSEDVYYRIRYNLATSFPTTLSLGGATTTISLNVLDPANREIVSEGNARNHIRTVVKHITATDGFDFEFALQSGLGGISLSNNAVVIGDVYANGPVRSTNTGVNAYNYVHGNVVSAGSLGYVHQIHATGTVYSHTIKNATIDKDAYYQTFDGATSSVTVAGVKYPNSVDQPTTTLPIRDELISRWEDDASAGGTATCTGSSYTINASATIGPIKIPCDLSITGNGTVVNLKGAVWTTGNISINGTGGSGVQIKVDDSIGNKSVPIIAENPGNNSTSAVITVDGNSNFYGSTGNADSYVMLVSQNNSAENAGGNLAINIINGASGNLLTYAAHGEIKLQNNVNLREVTAYKMTLINNSTVSYSLGLGQTLFTSGTGGTWKVSRWKER